MSTRGSSRFVLCLWTSASCLELEPSVRSKTCDLGNLLLRWSARSVKMAATALPPTAQQNSWHMIFWLMSQRYYFNILCWRRRFLSRKFLCQVALTRCCRLVRSPPSTSCFCSAAGALHNISGTAGRHRSQADSDVGQPPWWLLVSQSLRFRHQRRPEPSAPNSSTQEWGTTDTSHPQPAADHRKCCHRVSTLACISIR